MMRLSRLEAKVELQSEELICLNTLAHSCAQMLAPMAEKMNITISIHGEAKLTATRKRLEELLGNLMDNALQYNKNGGSVKVMLFEDCDVVIMTVEDTGIGIAKEHHERIFERFFMVDKARSGDVRGTGLGLSIVKHVATQLGGTLDIISELGKGTTISVIFKKHRGEPHA
jgi:two-component system phosphate regulon sensor histidine kinase PhoR